jgi:hypothetical protein
MTCWKASRRCACGRSRAWRGKLALGEDWARFVSRIEALGDERLLAPMGEIAEPHGWAKASYLALALHALDEVAHHGGEIGLMRDLYLRQGEQGRL